MKTKGAAYGFWAVLGPLGAHRFYLKRPWWTGVAQLALFIPFLLWLPQLAHYVNGAFEAALSMDLSNPNTISNSATAMPELNMGWAGWALGVNQVWWLIDAALIPRWVDEANGEPRR